MTITTCTKGIWDISDVQHKVNAGRWVTYDPANDPKKLESSGNQDVWGEGGLNLGAFSVSSPVQIPGTTWCALCFGSDTAAALKTDGTLWVWGRNSNGQLGQSNIIHKSSPVQIPGTTWCYIAMGKEDAQGSAFAIRTDNTLWAWGSNALGEAGVNSTTVLCYSSPVQIPGTTWCKATSGIDTHMALRTDGTLWSWGTGTNGNTGQNVVTAASSPTQLAGTWIDMTTHIDGGLAVKNDNTLWSWGLNTNGQLGQSDRVHRSSPVQIPGTTWCAVSSSDRSVLALRTDGTLWSWGINTNGQLGISNRAQRSSPVQIPGTTWCKIRMGYDRAMAQRTDGTLWMWGLNTLIDGQALNARSSPVQIPGECWIDFSVGLCTNGMLRY
jgi:alpha-tubulin suppressor-like RCC1 family protein